MQSLWVLLHRNIFNIKHKHRSTRKTFMTFNIFTKTNKEQVSTPTAWNKVLFVLANFWLQQFGFFLGVWKLTVRALHNITLVLICPSILNTRCHGNNFVINIEQIECSSKMLSINTSQLYIESIWCFNSLSHCKTNNSHTFFAGIIFSFKKVLSFGTNRLICYLQILMQ